MWGHWGPWEDGAGTEEAPHPCCGPCPHASLDIFLPFRHGPVARLPHSYTSKRHLGRCAQRTVSPEASEGDLLGVSKDSTRTPPLLRFQEPQR